jgi:hypothetical protein
MEESTTKQFSAKKTIIILVLIVVAISITVISCNRYLTYKKKEENEAAKVSLRLDLHTIAENLERDSAFLNPYINTYIETEGAIYDFTRSDYGGDMSFGIIGIHATDSALFVNYPLDYAALESKKNPTACDEEKLLFQKLDNRTQAQGFIYADVEFNEHVKYDIKPHRYNSTCGTYEYDPYTTTYDLEYFTLERIKVKGILVNVFKNKKGIYCLTIDNSVELSREKI